MATLVKSVTQSITWEKLDIVIREGRAEFVLDIGDKLEFELKNGNKVSVEVAAINPYGNNVVFSFENILCTAKMNYNNSNIGGWCESDMVDCIEKEVFPLIPEDLAMVIKPRTIYQMQGDRIYERESMLWIPSYTEVSGNCECYRKCDIGDVKFPLFNSRENMIRFDLIGILRSWWLRTPRSDSESSFWRIDIKGNRICDCPEETLGILPCFLI